MEPTGGDPPPSGDPERDSAAELVGGFPRHATRDLVEAEEERERVRTPLAGWLLAAGAALLTLGLPTERLQGPGPALVEQLSGGGWAAPRALYLPLAQLVDAIPGVRAEPAAYLLSALACGGLALVLWRLGRRLEVPPQASLMTCLLVLTAPVVWIASTSPGPEVAGSLAALYAFSALLSTRRLRWLRAALGLVFAAGLAPLYLWCLPAAAWGLARGGSARRSVGLGLGWGAACLLAWLGGTALAQQLAGSDAHGWLDLARELSRELTVGGGGPDDPRWLWIGFPALGAAWLGALGWFTRDSSGERAPAWVLAWVLLPALGLGLGGDASWELPWLWALGPLALGLYRLLNARPVWTGRAATLALAGVAILSVVTTRQVTDLRDPQAGWRTVAERELERGDLLLTTSSARQHLAAQRYALRAFPIHETARLSAGYQAEALGELVRRIQPAHAAGARVVLDRPLGAHEDELRALVQELERSLRIDVLPAAGAR